MAIYRAKVNFSGIVSMSIDEERELDNAEVIKDLLQAGYIELVYEEGPALKAAAEEPAGKTVEETASGEVTEGTPEEPAEKTAEETASGEVTEGTPEEPAEKTAEKPDPDEEKAEKKKGKK